MFLYPYFRIHKQPSAIICLPNPEANTGCLVAVITTLNEPDIDWFTLFNGIMLS